jgi:menaquinone-9 beta-reductase
MAWDAIVVGAGPAGSASAILLSRMGLRVALLDKALSMPAKVCGEYLSPGTLRLLDLLGGTPLLQERGARPLRGMNIHTAGGKALRAVYPPDEGGRERGGLAVCRTVLDPALIELAVRAGAEYLPGVQALDVLVEEGGTVVGVRARARGGIAIMEARVVIGADGRGSVVARRIGQVRRHSWLKKMALTGYFADVDRCDDRGEIFLSRDSYSILNPIRPGLTNVALVVSRRDYRRIRDPASFLAALGRTHPQIGDRMARARTASPVRALGPLAYRATRVAVPGALLVGDAAGFLDPFTGEGIYTALRTAEMAAERIGERLACGVEEHPDLRSYASDWKRDVLPKWKMANLLQRAIRRPWIAECLVSQLASRPALTSYLLAAFGDLVPPSELGLVRLLVKVLSIPGAAIDVGDAS